LDQGKIKTFELRVRGGGGVRSLVVCKLDCSKIPIEFPFDLVWEVRFVCRHNEFFKPEMREQVGPEMNGNQVSSSSLGTKFIIIVENEYYPKFSVTPVME
jgi:hypothetical protein